MNIKKYISISAIALIFGLSIIPAALAQGAIGSVDNFTVKEVGNQSVTLKWDAVEGADAYTILYGTNSVSANDEEYNRPPVVTEKVTEYKVTNLSNSTKYYFNIFAIAGQETSENLAFEVEATPTAEGTNAAPTIVGTTVVNPTTTKIVFSKEMKFPADLKSAINIVKSFDGSALAISNVTATDTKTLTLTTAVQDEGAEYRLTLNDKFADKAGVAVATTERSDIFIGANSVDDLFGSAEGTSDLEILEANIAPDKLGVELVFSKEVTFEENATAQIAIVETANPSGSSVNVENVIINPNDPTKYLVVTDELKDTSYTILVLRLKDKEGKLIAEENSTIEFGGGGEAGAAAGEVTDLEARFVDIAKILVQLTWGLNADIDAETLQGFRVYVAEGANSPFRLLGDLEKDAVNFDTEELTPADLYRFQVKTVDADGVESEGAVVELELPGTGPAGLAMLALSSLGLGRFATRRKK